MLPNEIDKLKRNIVSFGELAEKMISKAVNGLLQDDKALLKSVIEEDEPEANRTELVIDEECVNLIAQFQPKAVDLRSVLMGLKMNNDLERICDLAVNLAESALYLIEKPRIKDFKLIPQMASRTKSMLKDSLNSFVNQDALLARSVCERDSEVDSLRDQVWRKLIDIIKKDRQSLERALYLMGFSRYLERIADLSTNICEDVIFIVQGQIIKHHKESDEE